MRSGVLLLRKLLATEHFPVYAAAWNRDLPWPPSHLDCAAAGWGIPGAFELWRADRPRPADARARRRPYVRKRQDRLGSAGARAQARHRRGQVRVRGAEPDHDQGASRQRTDHRAVREGEQSLRSPGAARARSRGRSGLASASVAVVWRRSRSGRPSSPPQASARRRRRTSATTTETSRSANSMPATYPGRGSFSSWSHDAGVARHAREFELQPFGRRRAQSGTACSSSWSSLSTGTTCWIAPALCASPVRCDRCRCPRAVPPDV